MIQVRVRSVVKYAVCILGIIVALLTVQAAACADWYWPFPTSRTVSSGFRPEDRPDHNGVDIMVSSGDPIYAPANGRIVNLFTGCENHSHQYRTCLEGGICHPNAGFSNYDDTYHMCNNGFGNGVVILTEDGWYIQFAHMNEVLSGFYEGQTVSVGMLLGYAGDTGHAYGVHCHYQIGNGNGYDQNPQNPLTAINYFYKEDVELVDHENPVITSIAIKNKTQTGYDAMCTVSDDWGIGYIQIGSWNEQDGIDHTVWQTCAAPDPGGVAVIHVEISDPWNTHYTNFYVFDSVGKRSEAVGSGPIVIDSTRPEITMAKVENVTMQGYDILCEAMSNDQLNKIQTATWNEAVGIDNAIWKDYAVTAFPMRIHVSTEPFGYLQNTTYHTNVFAYDDSMNVSEARTLTVMIETEPPVVIDHGYSNVTSKGYDVFAVAEDDGLVQKIRIGTWDSIIPVENARWQVVEFDPIQHAETSFHVDIADFDNAQDVTYYTNVEVYDRCGNVTVVGPVSVLIERIPDISEMQVFYFPEELKVIDQESFSGTQAEAVVIPASCKKIASKAFDKCPGLKFVIISEGAQVEIANDAFDESQIKIYYQ